jgi:hypothetical protein
VKIETDETEDYRPHSQVRLVVTGQHERPVLIRKSTVSRQAAVSGGAGSDQCGAGGW